MCVMMTSLSQTIPQKDQFCVTVISFTLQSCVKHRCAQNRFEAASTAKCSTFLPQAEEIAIQCFSQSHSYAKPMRALNLQHHEYESALYYTQLRCRP